jgi:hypothetical protein
LSLFGCECATTEKYVQVTVATQTGHESPDLAFNPEKMTTDKHCYECKVRYKDPKPQDLVMYLHAWKYKVSWRRQIEKEKHVAAPRHNKPFPLSHPTPSKGEREKSF